MRLLKLLPILALSAASLFAQAQHYTFMVTGDDRSSGMPGRAGYDENGVNKTIMKEIVSEILRLKPKFLLFNGDLVAGYTTEEVFRSQLVGWLDIMKPVYAAGVHVYPARGNHDAYSKNAEKVWNEVFRGPYALPQNGPDHEKNFTFAAHEENALILGLDQWDTHEHSINQRWLNEQLAKNKLPIILTLGHEMAFMAGHHTDCLDNNEYARDTFINSLADAGARVYLAGHDHFYDHMEITDPKNHPNLNIHQFVVGTAGAPFYEGSQYTGHNGSWQLNQVKHIEQSYGYMIGEVDGLNVKLTFYGRTAPNVYEAMDTFSYTAAAKK
jgi:hypothetical protein